MDGNFSARNFVEKSLFAANVLAPYLRRRKAHDLDISTMWGRVFDLRQKELVSLDGFDLYVMPNDYVGGYIQRSKSYEPHVTSLIRARLAPGDVFLDLGANLGFYTLLAARIVGERGKVIAFEPNPQNLQLLYSSLLKNAIGNVEVHPYAVSDAAGILRFLSVGSNGLVITDESKDQRHFFLVQSVVLDRILASEERIDLVKIDIEAHELHALRGMTKLIETHRPNLVTEFHPWAIREYTGEEPLDYLNALVSLGYRLSIIETSGNVVETDGPSAVMSYWRALDQERIHLDLFAAPLR